MEAHRRIADLHPFAERGDLPRPRKGLAAAQRHDGERLARRQHGAMAGAGMVGMTMRDQGARDPARGVDVKIAGHAIEPGRGEGQNIFGIHRAKGKHLSGFIRPHRWPGAIDTGHWENAAGPAHCLLPARQGAVAMDLRTAVPMRERADASGLHRDGAGDPANGERGPAELGPEEIWQEPANRLLIRLATTSAGLDAAEAQSRLKIFGPNAAAAVRRSPLWLQFLGKFRNPLTIILLVASALSAATGDVASFVIIIAIVTLSITLDFVQEVRAQNAVEALRRSVAVQATVRRNGASLSVPIDRLVPGDIVELIAGDLSRRIRGCSKAGISYVNQALLTGEPYPAEKQVSDAASGAENPAGASNTVFAGTSAISGTATILICRTGSRTALGHLAISLAEKPPATAFAVGIRRFGMLIMRFTVFMVLFVVVVNIFFDRPLLESLLFAVALAVGLTPELMPMIVTVTLARSAMQMAKRKVIVKRLYRNP